MSELSFTSYSDARVPDVSVMVTSSQGSQYKATCTLCGTFTRRYSLGLVDQAAQKHIAEHLRKTD